MQKNKKRKFYRRKIKRNKRVIFSKKESVKQFVRKKPKQFSGMSWKRLGVLLLVIMFFVLVVWVLFFSGVLTIVNINVKIDGRITNNQQAFSQKIIKITQDIQREKYWNKISMNNLILFPSQKLDSKIKTINYAIKDVNINKEFPGTLNIQVISRNKLTLWLDSKKQCMLVDENGLLLATIDCQNKPVRVIQREMHMNTGLPCLILEIQSASDDFVNEKEAIVDYINKSYQIHEGIKKTYFYNENVRFVISNILSKEIVVQDDDFGEIFFSTDNNIDTQLEKLNIFLSRKITPKQLESVEYIDLRIKNKIIYKLKEGADEQG